MKTPSLLHTERRLVTLFVGGAFLFLLIFEGVFLGSRIILENKFQKEDFEKASSHVIDRISSPESKPMRSGRPPIGIGFVTIDATGKVIENRIGGDMEYETIEGILDVDFITALPLGKTASYSGYYIQKITNPRDSSLQTLIIKNGGYGDDDIIRDILRFLALDLLILLPFWFLGRYFVREILKPIEENMTAMSHFVHDAGHELKTPLAIISGNLQILRDMKGKDSDLIETSISMIHSMGDSLDGLVELSNLKLPEKRENIGLLEHTEEIIKLYEQSQKKKNISISVDIPKNARIRVENKHFSILMANLLKNAITYNRDGGTIDIRYKNKILSIKDTGIGMKKEESAKIFDRFYRVDRSGIHPGSGIGLALVERIIKLYDWSISVESILGRGSCFSIEIK